MDSKAGRFLRRVADYPAGSHHLVPENLRGRTLLHLPARGGVSEPPLRANFPHLNILRRTGELPLALHGRVGRRGARSAAGAPVRAYNKYSFGKLLGSCSLK